jgi:hypothetical protein
MANDKQLSPSPTRVSAALRMAAGGQITVDELEELLEDGCRGPMLWFTEE